MKKIISLVLIMSILACGLPLSVKAVCSHSSLGPQYSEAAHPHRYYRECMLCHEKIYTGGRAIKKHGNGAWGSGTCPECGIHTLGQRYSDASHPHKYYRICSVCSNKVYVGGQETKAHGTGAWGSGTCPQCGSHVYGATYSEAEHPHNYYHTCTLCNKKEYTGGHATKNHGNGAWGSGTCPSCGSHTYIPPTDEQIRQSAHPHPYIMQCACGASINQGNVPLSTCSLCQQGKKTAFNEINNGLSFLYFDGNGNIGVPITVTINVHLSFTEEYRKDVNSAFQSFGASANASLSNVPTFLSDLIVFINPAVKYFNSSNTVLYNIDIGGSDLSKSRGAITKTPFPSYSVVTVTGSLGVALNTPTLNMSVSYTS